MEQMQREMELGDGMDPDEFSIGNSVEDPEPAPGEEVGVRGGVEGRGHAGKPGMGSGARRSVCGILDIETLLRPIACVGPRVTLC